MQAQNKMFRGRTAKENRIGRSFDPLQAPDLRVKARVFFEI
jgi:hypothetical protein